MPASHWTPGQKPGGPGFCDRSRKAARSNAGLLRSRQAIRDQAMPASRWTFGQKPGGPEFMMPPGVRAHPLSPGPVSGAAPPSRGSTGGVSFSSPLCGGGGPEGAGGGGSAWCRDDTVEANGLPHRPAGLAFFLSAPVPSSQPSPRREKESARCFAPAPGARVRVKINRPEVKGSRKGMTRPLPVTLERH